MSNTTREGEAPAEPRRARRHPVHGIKYVEGQPTIIFDTMCTKGRTPAFANVEFHSTFRAVAGNATAWLMGRYVIMPDHIHFFAGDVGRDIPYENWIKYLKSQLTKALAAQDTGGEAPAEPTFPISVGKPTIGTPACGTRKSTKRNGSIS